MFPTAPLWAVATVNDETLPETTDPECELRYIDIGSVSRERGVEVVENVSFDQAPSRARRVVRAGDVIVSTVRTYLRAVARVEAAHDGCIASTGFAVLRARAGTDSRFLAYAVSDVGFVDGVVANSVGVSYPAISSSSLIHLRLPKPIDETAVAVADFLDRECERIDRAMSRIDAVWNRLREAYVAERRELLGQAVTTTRLGRITTCLDARRIPLNREERSLRQGSIPYWGANSIQDYVDDYLFDETLVLVGEDGAPFFDAQRDVAWVIQGKSWVNNHAHVLRPHRGWNPHFLAEVLNDTDYALHITGATRDKLTQDDMNAIRVPAMSQPQQERVAARLNGLADAVASAIASGTALKRGLAEYRDASVHGAVTGKLDLTTASEQQMDERLHAAAEGRLDEVTV
jgi:restriction endonuclease S subunit